jgi:hypothetical protein
LQALSLRALARPRGTQQYEIRLNHYARAYPLGSLPYFKKPS